VFSDPHRQAHAQADDVVHLPGNDEHRQRRDVADEVHAARHAAGAYQVDGVQQQGTDRPERPGTRAGYAVVEAQGEALRDLPLFLDRSIGIQRRLGRAAEQQVDATGEDDHWQHLVQPFGWHVVGDDGAEQRPGQGGEQRRAPLRRVEQFAFVVSETCSGRAEGGTELVGAQYQVRWHAGSEQGRGGEQAPATGDGVDESGDEGDQRQDEEG